MAWIAFAWLLAAPTPPETPTVDIVLSHEATPYRQAAAGAEERFKRENIRTQTTILDEYIKNRSTRREAGIAAVVAIGTKATKRLQDNIKPPVKLTYCMVADPTSADLAGKAAPRGVATDVPIRAQFDLIAEALPSARSVGLLYRSDTRKGQRLLQTASAALPRGWRLRSVAVDRQPSVAKAIERLFSKGIDIVWAAPDSSVYNAAAIRSLLLAALRRKTPVFGFSKAFVRAGALVGISVNPRSQGEQAADLTSRLLREKGSGRQSGVKERDQGFPYEFAEFQIAVNLSVAAKLSVDLPPPLVKRAAHVFGSGKGKRRR